MGQTSGEPHRSEKTPLKRKKKAHGPDDSPSALQAKVGRTESERNTSTQAKVAKADKRISPSQCDSDVAGTAEKVDTAGLK